MLKAQKIVDGFFLYLLFYTLHGGVQLINVIHPLNDSISLNYILRVCYELQKLEIKFVGVDLRQAFNITWN